MAFFAPLKELQRLSEAQPGMGKSLLDRLEGTTWLDERKCPIAHIQSGEIFWSNTMASMASLISDGTIVVTISHGDVVARGDVAITLQLHDFCSLPKPSKQSTFFVQESVFIAESATGLGVNCDV
ncbi:unnamed protein product [Durusdinium trenchii]|uniref:Uncharacterized protein n=1 Tax=Durusdinium trenchii TaxID=1381693 RepID=A0ABP0QKB0_9DINO